MTQPASGLEREFGYMIIQDQNQRGGALPPGLAPRPKPQHDAPKPYRPAPVKGGTYRAMNYQMQPDDEFPPPPPPQGHMGYVDEQNYPPPPPPDQNRAYHYPEDDYPPPPPPGGQYNYQSKPVPVRTSNTGYTEQTSYGNPASSYNSGPGYTSGQGGVYRNPDQSQGNPPYGSSPSPKPLQAHATSTAYADVSGLPSHSGPAYSVTTAPPATSSYNRPSSGGQPGQATVYHATGPTKPVHQDSNSAGKEAEVDALTNLLLQNMESAGDPDFFGMCAKCGKQVIGENNGCTAMDQVYHITCFICVNCTKMLRGLPFYSMENKPYCEECYLSTLEKCSVCSKIITDRLLRATGKPYHPACFMCVVCGKSLDGVPFTVDATNQIHCIEDFHRKFAPRCCVCHHPIMPEHGKEETVRVVAMDRSFHVNCYRCEDCGTLLSSEAEGRGCYPLDDHILCKNCNAKRIQALTTKMSTEL